MYFAALASSPFSPSTENASGVNSLHWTRLWERYFSFFLHACFAKSLATSLLWYKWASVSIVQVSKMANVPCIQNHGQQHHCSCWVAELCVCMHHAVICPDWGIKGLSETTDGVKACALTQLMPLHCHFIMMEKHQPHHSCMLVHVPR